MKNFKMIGVLLVSILIPFIVNAETLPCVAKIDDVCYESLELAYEEVKYNENELVDGKTIVLQEDVNLREIGYNPSNPMIFDFADNVILDLNGHFIKARGNSVFYQGNNLTIKNGTFKTEFFGCGDVSKDDSYPLHIGYVRQTSNIVLDNLTINGGVNVFNAKKVKIQNSNVTGNQAYYGVWADSYAEIIILSGNYTTPSKHGIIGISSVEDKEGSVSVFGGTFTIGDNKLFCNSSACLEGIVEGGTFDKNVEDFLPSDSFRVKKVDGKFVVEKKLNVLVGDIHGNGDIRFSDELVFPGEEVTMTFTPLEGYEFDSVEVFDDKNNKIEVKDNKFEMPNSDVWVGVKFKPIQKAKVPVVDKDNNVGVSNAEKTEDVLLESLSKNDKYKDLTVTVEVVVEDIKADKIDEKVSNSFIKALEDEKVSSGKIVSYFDITVAVKNTQTDKVEGKLEKLTDKIEFTVAIPKLDAVKEGYTRTYYIIKQHKDIIEILDTVISKDGKFLTFETDEFSTYALAYEDKAKVVEEEKVETKPETNEGGKGEVEAAPEVKPEVKPEDNKGDEIKPENNVEVPQTSDEIISTLISTAVVFIGLVAVSYYFKKELDRKGL